MQTFWKREDGHSQPDGFSHYTVAGSQRRGDLPGEQVERQVPGRNISPPRPMAAGG